MFLENLRVENIRSLSDVSVDFVNYAASDNRVRKWTLLVGENGTGKSTLLKAAALLLAGSNALPDLLGDPSSWVRNGARFGRISGRLRTQEWEPREISLEIFKGDTRSDLLKRNDATLSGLDGALSRATQNYFTAAYGPYRRVSDERSPISSFSRLPRAQCLVTLFDKNAVVNPLPSWAMTLEYQRGDEGLSIVRDAMNALMPGVAFVDVDKSRGTLRFETQDGIVSLEQLSDGFQNVAAWIGDLLFRITEAFAHHREPLKARGLLLIDEIDAHLHPAWQRKLREFLSDKLPNFQIVATTHSPLTLQQAHQDEAIILSRSEDRTVAASVFPGDPSKLRLHQLYDLAFKISSLDSWEIEQSKDTYRNLSAKPAASLTPVQAVALAEAKQTLELVQEPERDGMGNEALTNYFTKLTSAVDALERGASGRPERSE
jgi:hypothetical protein